MFNDRFSNFCYCIFILLCLFSIPSFAQLPLPSCNDVVAGGCVVPSNLGAVTCAADRYRIVGGVTCASPSVIGVACSKDCSCPSGYSLNTVVEGGVSSTTCSENTGGDCPSGEAIDPTSGTCAPSFDDPFSCSGGAAGGTAVQNSTGGYSCQVGDNYPCPAGTTPGTAFDGNGNSINTCMADNGNSSSDSNSSSQNSSSGTGSSSGSGGDDGGSGGDSSDGGNNGNSSSSSSTGSGGNSSGTASSSGTGGSASSAGAGDCDPTADDYALCIGFTEEVGDNEAQQIVDGVTGDAQELLDGIYGDIEDDIEAAGIDGEFVDAPSDLENAVMAFLPSPAQCTPFSFQFLGQTKQLPCEKFQEFRLIFGWFLTLCAAAYIWQITIKPVER